MHRLGKCSLLFMKHPPRCSCHSPVRCYSCHSSVRLSKLERKKLRLLLFYIRIFFIMFSRFRITKNKCWITKSAGRIPQTTKLSIHNLPFFFQFTKIDTHKNNWIHSNRNYYNKWCVITYSVCVYKIKLRLLLFYIRIFFIMFSRFRITKNKCWITKNKCWILEDHFVVQGQ
jgi:hypothetical protein